MEQIERQVMEDVATGGLRPGERLPTPAELGAQLGVSAGAVEKAYRRLAKAGIIESQPGVGPFIAETALSTQHALYEVAGNAIAIAINRARRLGCHAATSSCSSDSGSIAYSLGNPTPPAPHLIHRRNRCDHHLCDPR